MTTPIGSSDGEREAFEAAMRDAGENPRLWTKPVLGELPPSFIGKYILREHQVAWSAWQARAALSSDREMAPEAMNDTTRLDWLAANGIAIERDIEGDWRTVQYHRYGSPIRGPERITLRGAIDAALASSVHIAQRNEKP